MNFSLGFFKTVKTPDQRKNTRKELLFCSLSGIMLGLSFPPINISFLIFFSLVPYFYVISRRTGLAEINRATYLTALIFTLISLYWVGSWTKDADPFLMLAGSALIFFNPIVFLIASTLYYFTRKIFNRVIALLLLPFFWVFYEYFYSITDLRFPWLTLGHSLSSLTLLAQPADLIGAYGLSFIIILINALIFFSFDFFRTNKKISYSYIICAISVFLFLFIYGFIKQKEYTDRKYDTIKAGLIQPDLNPWKKWESAGDLNKLADIYFNLSFNALQSGAAIIVWPETAFPVYLYSGSYYEIQNRIKTFADYNRVDLITGMPDATFFFNTEEAPPDAKPTPSGNAKYVSYNSALHIKPFSNEISKYGKQKLVPFGERVPFIDVIPALGDWIKWEVGISSWNVGKDTTVFNLFNKSASGKEVKAACIICIESIYQDYVAQFVKKGADFIIVVTNDSWYGKSSGPYQHKDISVLRAIENRRAVVRAANGGISCIISPSGKVVKETKLFTKIQLTGNIFLNKETTFYSRNPLLIPNITIAVSIVIFLLFLIIKLTKHNLFKKLSRKN